MKSSNFISKEDKETIMTKEWHIWDFPDCVYVKFTDNFRIKLYNKLKEKYKTRKAIGKALKCDPQKITDFFKHNESSCFLSVKTLKKIIRIFPAIRNELEGSIVVYRARNKGYIYNPILPIKECPELYNIVMHLLGDGSFNYYSNTCKELREEFRNNLEIFGNLKTNERLLHGNVYVIEFSRIISHILEHIFDIQIIRPDRLPKALFKSSKGCKISAIRAIFDDEGTIKEPQRFSLFSICSSSISFLEDVKKVVEDLNIKTGTIFGDKREAYHFNISTKSYEKFLNEIGFTHPKKLDRLKKTVKYKNRFKNIRKRIIQLIEEKPRDRFEIADEIGHSLGSITVFMYQLRRQGVIKSNFVGKNKNYIWTRA